MTVESPAEPSEPPRDTGSADPGSPTRRTRRLALNTAIFSAATGLSRIAGLIREVVASSYFGTSGPFSAFTLAFQLPNLVRSLFADAALSAAFVPVFTEQLEHGRKRDAARLASTLLLIILAALGAITALFVLAAGWVMPLFVGDSFDAQLTDLTVGLSQVLFPIVVLLGVNGLVVGILNSYEHFAIPAIAPLVWNVVIIGVLVGLRPLFDGPDELYAYAIGVLAGTTVQLLMSLPTLSRVGFRFQWAFDWRDPRVKRVFRLMLPVTIGLGAINFSLLINSVLGSLVSEEAPRAIDAAFRVYMLPQGMFSVALATVLFPTLSRFAARRDLDGLRRTMASGVRQIALLLIPAAAFSVVLAEPITRLVYERGAFDAESTELVSTALFWFSFSLPLSGINLLLTRSFFSLQKPWQPTAMAGLSLLVNAIVSVALYAPFGIGGIVIGTVAGNVAMALGQARTLRPLLHGSLEGRRTLLAALQMTAAAVLLGAVAFGVWWALDQLLGRALLAQVLSVGAALAAGVAVYVGAVLAIGIEEARQIRALVAGRFKRGR